MVTLPENRRLYPLGRPSGVIYHLPAGIVNERDDLCPTLSGNIVYGVERKGHFLLHMQLLLVFSPLFFTTPVLYGLCVGLLVDRSISLARFLEWRMPSLALGTFRWLAFLSFFGGFDAFGFFCQRIATSCSLRRLHWHLSSTGGVSWVFAGLGPAER
jgi:hypothetical protein